MLRFLGNLIRSKKERNAREAHKTSVLRALAALVPGATGSEPYFRLDQFSNVIEKSVWLYSAVYRVANVIASTKLRVVETDTNRDAKGRAATDLRKLLKGINPDDTSFGFRQAQFIHLKLDGEAIAQKARDGLGRVTQLWNLSPKDTTVVPDKTGQRRIGSFIWRGGLQPISIPREEVVFCRDYHPSDEYRGMSPVAPLKRELDWDLRAARFNIALIDEGMRLGGVLRPKEGLMPTEEDWEQVKAALRLNNQGSRNAGRFLLLSLPFDFTPDGISPADMEMMEGRKMVRDMSASVVGSAPMMLQNYDSASYANSDAQIRQFWDHIGKPLLIQWCSAMNEQLVVPDFSEDIEIQADYAGIDAQIDSEKTRIETTSRAMLSGIISLNEARERMGLEPVDGGEVHFVQGAIVPMKPGEFVNPLAQAANNRPQDAPPGQDQSGGPANPADGASGGGDQGGKPQAPRASSDNPQPNKRLNGHAAERFSEATAVLSRLSADVAAWRLDAADPGDAGRAASMTFQTRKALVAAIEQMSGKKAASHDAPVHRAIGEAEAEMRSARDEFYEAAAKSGDVMDDAALDPFKVALPIWTRITPMLARAAEEL